MAARIGLDRPAVVAAAIAIVDAEGVDALSMARLAGELGIRGPSLYAHVRNQAELRRELVAVGARRPRASACARRSWAAAAGRRSLRSPPPCATTRASTRRRYLLTLQPPVPFDDAAVAASHRANGAFRAVIRSFGLEGDEAVHCGRALAGRRTRLRRARGAQRAGSQNRRLTTWQRELGVPAAASGQRHRVRARGRRRAVAAGLTASPVPPPSPARHLHRAAGRVAGGTHPELAVVPGAHPRGFHPYGDSLVEHRLHHRAQALVVRPVVALPDVHPDPPQQVRVVSDLRDAFDRRRRAAPRRSRRPRPGR